MPTSLRKSVAANLRNVRESLLAAERDLTQCSCPDPCGDMTPAEIAEARALLSGIRARVALEIFSLEQPPAPAKANA